MKLLGGVKLSVPLVELILRGVEGLRKLCDQVAGMGRELARDVPLSPLKFEIGAVYSASQCLEMLLTHLPLFRDLFSLVMATFKKIQTHVSG